MLKISPSLLSCDFSKIGDEVVKVDKAGADMIHIDVMDGHFVPNITLGPPIVKAFRKCTKLEFDVHLMIDNPDNYIVPFIDAGADIVTVHAEVCPHLHRTIQSIKEKGKKAGVALNPSTPLSYVDWVLEDLDMILLMTVNPGFGGQSYISAMTEKIRTLRKFLDSKGLNIDIQVDGGIDLETIKVVTEAGANVIVSGSTIFKAKDTVEIIKQLRQNSAIKSRK